MNKQACYTLSALSALLGPRFQDHAAFFLPTLFKVLPITVQVNAPIRTPRSHTRLPGAIPGHGPIRHR